MKQKWEIEDLALDIIKKQLDDFYSTDIGEQVHDAWAEEGEASQANTDAVEGQVRKYAKQLQAAIELWQVNLKLKREMAEKVRQVVSDLKG